MTDFRIRNRNPDVQSGTATPTPGSVVAASISNSLSDQRGIVSKLHWTFKNVRAYGAVGDGVTNDLVAFQAAASAAQSDGTAVYIPGGLYGLSAPWVLNWDDVQVVTDGQASTGLKALSAMSYLVHIGITDGTRSPVDNASISGFYADGNSLCSEAVVKAWCTMRGTFSNIRAFGGVVGFLTDTATTSVNTANVGNLYLNIETHNNTGTGFKTVGEKDSRSIGCYSHNNGGDGFECRAFLEDGLTLAETTQCLLVGCVSRDNTGSGYGLDGVEKYHLSGCISAINGGRGIEFRSSDIATMGNTASNSIVLDGFESRNDDDGVIGMADDAQLVGPVFGPIFSRGDNSTAAAAIDLKGAVNVKFGSTALTAWPNLGIRIREGTPLGGSAVQSANIVFTDASILDGGSGVSVENSSNGIHFLRCHSQNDDTTVANSLYEVTVASTATARFDYLRVQAAESGRELSGSEYMSIGTLRYRSEGDTILIKEITAPTANITGHTRLYSDTANGLTRQRTDGGTVTNVAQATRNTWTPVISGSTTPGTNTYDRQTGVYTVIDDVVFFEIRLRMTAKDGAMAGFVQVSLPLTVGSTASSSSTVSLGQINNLDLGATVVQVNGQAAQGAAVITLYEMVDNGSAIQLQAAAIQATTELYLSGFYKL
jgi:hypothetical protein